MGHREFYLCNPVQTSLWAHPASHSIDTRTSFLTGKVADNHSPPHCLILQMTQSTLSQIKAHSVLHRWSLVFLLIPDHIQQLYNRTSLCRQMDIYFQVHCLISWTTDYTTCRCAMLSCTVIGQVTYRLPQHEYVTCWIEATASIFIKIKILCSECYTFMYNVRISAEWHVYVITKFISTI